MTDKQDVIPGEKFALPVTWVRGIKLRLLAFFLGRGLAR